MVGVTVTFNFDPATETVTNVLCSVGGVTEQKVTTTKKTTVKKIGKGLEGLVLIREEGKLVLSPDIIAILEKDGDEEIRTTVNYQKVDGVITPFFGKDTAFGSKSGNKLAKAGSVAFRGKNNEILAEFGDIFSLEESKPGIWKLVGDKEYIPKNVPVEKAVVAVKAIEVSGDESTQLIEIADFTF